jgi:hypothetical protein
MPWKHNGKEIKLGKSWVANDGTQHPATWSKWSDSEKKANGLTWEDPPASVESFDEKFYLGRQEDGTLIEKSLTDTNAVDEDGNAIIDPITKKQIVNEGLKTVWIQRTKSVANSMLAKHDWQVVRKSEKGTSIDSDISTYRDAIRTKCGTIETAINNCSNLTEFKALFDIPTDSDGNATGNAPIDDWPDEI